MFLEKNRARLTRNGGGIFRMLPKIWCLNFKPHWLRTLRQNFARVVSLAAVQLVSKHARAPLTYFCTQYYKVATQENRKIGNFALLLF